MKKLGLIIKILILIAVIAVGILVYQMCSGNPLIQKIDKTLPDKTIAPCEVSTQTHIYCANNAILNDDGSVTMFDWWEKIGDVWVAHNGSITLPPKLHPRINRR